MRAVSESWYPSSKNDFGLILEDDIEVSVLYLRWITKILWNLHLKPDSRVVGISLYSPRVIETTSERTLFNSTFLVERATGIPELPYLFQTPCSWDCDHPVRQPSAEADHRGMIAECKSLGQ